jgi:hypothetical protein
VGVHRGAVAWGPHKWHRLRRRRTGDAPRGALQLQARLASSSIAIWAQAALPLLCLVLVSNACPMSRPEAAHPWQCRRVFLLDGRVLLIRPKLFLANDGNYRRVCMRLPSMLLLLSAHCCLASSCCSALGPGFCSMHSIVAGTYSNVNARTSRHEWVQGGALLCHLEAPARGGGARFAC